MLRIAWRTLRTRRRSFVAALIVLLCGSALISASAVLAETALGDGGEPARYAHADAVVIAEQSFAPEGGDVTTRTRLAESPRLPIELVEEIRAAPEVADATGDDDIDLMLSARPDEEPLRAVGHGWDAARLRPEGLADGEAPVRPEEVVLAAADAQRLDVSPGDAVTLFHRALPHEMRVSGIAADAGLEPGSVLVHEADARAFAPVPGRVSTIVVTAADGVVDEDVVRVLERTVDGHGAEVLTGASIGRAGRGDVDGGRDLLLVIATSFGGFAVLISLAMTAVTLALTLRARRREFAVLRALGATPGQVLSLVGSEAILLAGLAALIGALPGYAIAEGMRRVLADIGVMPEALALTFGPLPAVAAVLLTVLTAGVAAIAVAIGPARMRPVDAMRDAAQEPSRPARWRTSAGLVCLALGVGSALLPLGLRSEAGAAGTSSSALLLVIGVALIGPVLLPPLVAAVTRPVRRVGASGFLAAESARARAQRLGGVLTPLVLTIGFTLPMVSSQTILALAAGEQLDEGITADAIVADAGSGGIDPEVLDAIDALPETRTVTAMQDTQVLLPYSILGDPDVTATAARAVTPAGISTTLDPSTRSGDLAALDGIDTVALDSSTARIVRAEVGDDVDAVLGDGTTTELRVVAIYDRGLGLGGAILPNAALDGHAGAPHRALIATAESVTPAELRSALSRILEDHPTLSVADASEIAEQSRAESTMASWVNLTGLFVIVVFLGIAIVNNLVIATLGRSRELSLLRLVGTTGGQIRRMLLFEALVTVALAVLLGTVIAAIPVAVLNLVLLGSPLPAGPFRVYAGLVAAVAALTVVSTLLPARGAASRPRC